MSEDVDSKASTDAEAETPDGDGDSANAAARAESAGSKDGADESAEAGGGDGSDEDESAETGGPDDSDEDETAEAGGAGDSDGGESPKGGGTDDSKAAGTDSVELASGAGTARVTHKAASPPADEEADQKKKPKLPLHPVRGGLIAVVGAALPFVLMTADRQFNFSVPVGLLGLAIAAIGIFDLLGTFDPVEDQPVAGKVNLRLLGSRALEAFAAGAGLYLGFRLAVAGTLPLPRLLAALIITATFLGLVVSVYRVAEALGAYGPDADGSARPLLRRHGFWLVLFTTLLYLPMLGSFSLSDPWETHYGEVAREMLARDDWISLWWAQDGWFWSKPVLNFWMQGVSFSAFGVGYMPDQMLAGAAQGRFPQPEWAARLPVFLLTLAGGYFLYKGTAKVWGAARGAAGRAGAGDHALLVLDRSPDHDRHALRRPADGGDGLVLVRGVHGSHGAGWRL